MSKYLLSTQNSVLELALDEIFLFLDKSATFFRRALIHS